MTASSPAQKMRSLFKRASVVRAADAVRSGSRIAMALYVAADLQVRYNSSTVKFGLV